MDLLLFLLERRGELLSRADIEQRLWEPGIFVDSDAGIYTVVRKVRTALRDSATSPRFVETVRGRGYRFKAVVDELWDPQSPPWRLAVLPFDDLSPEAAVDYLANGLTEEVIAIAGQIEPARLGVIGRRTMMRYKSTSKSLARIGRELRATHLLEGAIQRTDGRLRITTRLVRMPDEVSWSASWDVEPEGLLGFQQALGSAIARQIGLHLPDKEPARRIERRHSADPRAYDLYLRGRSFFDRLTRDGMARAITHYERATSLDPSYALAWAGLADTWASRPINSDAAPADVLPNARAAVAQALTAGSDLAECWTSKGIITFWFDRDFPAAADAYRRAIDLDPGYPLAHRMLGHALSQMGRHEEARIAMQKAREIEPFYAMHHALSSQIAFQARDFGEAKRYAKRAIALDPDFWIGYMQLGQACERLHHDDEAIEALATSARLASGNSKPVALRAYTLAKVGERHHALDVLETFTALSQECYIPPYAMALVAAGLGDRAAVFDWLDRCQAAGDVHLVFLPVDAKWDEYRDDRRFPHLACKF